MPFSRRLCYVVITGIRAVISVVDGYRPMNGQIEWRSVIRRFEDLLSGTGGFPDARRRMIGNAREGWR
jgi:hypothetical protein